MNKLKSKLEELQVSSAINHMDLKQDSLESIEEQNNLRQQIEEQKSIYKQHYLALKNLKRKHTYIFFTHNMLTFCIKTYFKLAMPVPCNILHLTHFYS